MLVNKNDPMFPKEMARTAHKMALQTVDKLSFLIIGGHMGLSHKEATPFRFSSGPRTIYRKQDLKPLSPIRHNLGANPENFVRSTFYKPRNARNKPTARLPPEPNFQPEPHTFESGHPRPLDFPDRWSTRFQICLRFVLKI